MVMLVAIDMDGTIADFTNAACNKCKDLWGIDIKYEDVDTYKFAEVVRRHMDIEPREVYAEVFSSGFFASLDPTPGAIQALEEIHSDGNDILIVSKALDYEGVPHDKMIWLAEKLGHVPHTTFFVDRMEAKKYVNCHVIIDDDPRVIDYHPTALAIAVEQPWNVEFIEADFGGWTVNHMSEAPKLVRDIARLLGQDPSEGATISF